MRSLVELFALWIYVALSLHYAAKQGRVRPPAPAPRTGEK